MNNILFRYILVNFLKTFFIVTSIFYCFGLLLNLFEEIEFFKNIDVNIFFPLIMTSIYIPSIIIKLLPFIVFISSVWFMMKIRNNKDLITLKTFGYSNLKILFILAITSFFLGWLILVFINPLTSSFAKYYEMTKSNYSRDIDHLITFNKNGLWIKENLSTGKKRIIYANKLENKYLVDLKIFHLSQVSKLEEKITASTANIENNIWLLNDVKIHKKENDILIKEDIKSYEITSIYTIDKINTLFKNFDTISFVDLITNYDQFLDNGYNKKFLNQSLHTLLSMPFFLFLMTGLASIFTLNNLNKSDNFKLIVLGLLTCLITFYFKDLSLALGQTEKISLNLAVWSPVLALCFFVFIGVLQINEK